MTISFLKAGNGDCIHLHSGVHHVIIDSGEICNELVAVVDNIRKANEAIDLLVITHYDADHIKAIISILESLTLEERKELVKKVWFNATKVGFHRNEKLLSAQDATKLSHLLLEANINWTSDLIAGETEKIDETLTLEVIDGGEIYNPTGEGKWLVNEKTDWGSSLSELERYLDDDVVDESKTNSQSIIIVAHVNNKHILLPGDAIPSKLADALEHYREGEKKLKFDMIKLPHHGSYKNITHEVLEKFECSDYVVTTNGDKYFHPNKKMILKVIKWGQRIDGKKITFHLNYYDSLHTKLNIRKMEKQKYNFDCDGKREFEL